MTDQPPRRHALLVGIDHFEDARFSGLRFAAADARAFAAALTDFDDVRELVRPEETRRAPILQALADLEKRIGSPRDTVVIYFSTHGSLAQRPGGELERQLVASDTRLDLLRETGISVDELIRRAEKLPSRRVAVILASCHAGGGKSRIPDALARALAARKDGPPRLEDVSEAVVVLTAAAFGEAAREDETLGHDVYTYFLLEALAKGDRDGDGAVTASEAHDYARERTWQFTQGEQRPAAESTILGIDPIILRGHRERAGLPVVFSYARSAEGIVIRLAGQRKGVLPGGFSTAPGEQRLELLEAGSERPLYSGTIHLEPGDRMELSRLIPAPPRLEVSLGVGLVAPLSRASRDALPVAPAGALRLHARDWPGPALGVELGLSLFARSGTAATFDQPLPYQLEGVHLQVGAGRAFSVGKGLSLEPKLLAGVLWLSRRFRGAAFTSDESVRAATLSPAVELVASLFDAIRLGARLEASIFRAPLDGPPKTHAVGQASLFAGCSF